MRWKKAQISSKHHKNEGEKSFCGAQFYSQCAEWLLCCGVNKSDGP